MAILPNIGASLEPLASNASAFNATFPAPGSDLDKNFPVSPILDVIGPICLLEVASTFVLYPAALAFCPPIPPIIMNGSIPPAVDNAVPVIPPILPPRICATIAATIGPIIPPIP